jgi:hypothetical protein
VAFMFFWTAGSVGYDSIHVLNFCRTLKRRSNPKRICQSSISITRMTEDRETLAAWLNVLRLPPITAQVTNF